MRSKPSSSTIVMWVLSLTVALFIWLFSIRGGSFTVRIPVAVNYIIDAESVVLGNPPESVTVAFTADGLSMLGFQLTGRAGRLAVNADLRGLSADDPEQTTVIVFDGTLLESPSMSVNASGFMPASAEVSLDRVDHRALPVALVSRPSPSRYMSVHLRQPSVRVSGPASVIGLMDSVHTSTASSSIRMDQQVALDLPDGVEAEVTAVVARLRNPAPVVPSVRRAY